MRHIINILILLLVCGILKSQNFPRTYYYETLDSYTRQKIDKFLIDNYKEHSKAFYLNICTIYDKPDTVFHYNSLNEINYIRKYIFVFTFNDSIIGIQDYVLNFVFDKDFNIVFSNFPHDFGCKDLKIIPKKDIIKKAINIKPSFKNSLDSVNAKAIYKYDKDCFIWEVCREISNKNYECASFNSINGEILEEYNMHDVTIQTIDF